MNLPAPMRSLVERLTPRQRQYAMLGAILLGGVGLLWLVFAFAESAPSGQAAKDRGATPGPVTNIGVMPPGQQVNPVDQWVGTAGSKLAQYESEREEQGRLNKDRQAFEARTMQRFAELEQRLTATTQAVQAPVPAPVPSPAAAAPSLPPPSALPPPPPAPRAPAAAVPAMPPGVPPAPLSSALPLQTPAAPALMRIAVADRAAPSAPAPATADSRTLSTFLPVSFTRGTLLGGLDAPTGGQSQSNPHPVLIRLSDNSVLPNRFRGEYRDCFVIAAGYGDISSERAYLRTENLSCVRADGAALEVRIQGSVYGEDGKVGMRGRLVTKQGQMLANALLAGVVSGIGQGLATSSTSYSTSALGTIATASGADAYRAGLGTGVGRALDRLAQYYIKLAENTFPVIEVDAGREIDVVITKGVRIELPPSGSEQRAGANPPSTTRSPEADDDGSY
ncbi:MULTISPECIES: TraB/VirB10 family protein [unclassified Methylibium]|uniref:TraB/VirB10 family protein n=1 Tax=unclassified Methylibium TaxID=2633235 RepID=UPI0003F403EB|nr:MULTISPECIES: TraB/VirB10 family protein [unclassified Methylibium]EWS56789.1 conjugal transfer pilus assembly protein TraB [Methylibium sp. T29]EWS61949.1 conjugal transfer pilus assembly protein TraB [Methylibium sp. T29-B]